MTTISGSVTVGGQQFDYAEISASGGGAGPRGIKISAKGIDKSTFSFNPISPNPHLNPKYNDNQGQKAFYLAVANKIAAGYAFDAADVTAQPLVKDDERPKKVAGKEITGPAWTQLKVDVQRKLRAAANEEIKAANAKALTAEKQKQVVAHIKAAGKKTLTWEHVTYTLPAAVAN